MSVGDTVEDDTSEIRSISNTSHNSENDASYFRSIGCNIS